jgi:hypothetical protein
VVLPNRLAFPASVGVQGGRGGVFGTVMYQVAWVTVGIDSLLVRDIGVNWR